MRWTILFPIAVAVTLAGAWFYSSLPVRVPGVLTHISAGHELRIEPFVTGLDTVWDMVLAPDGSMWITERSGHISRIDLATGKIQRIGDVAVTSTGESGLLGMAFHPDFPRQPWIYFVHSYRGAGENIRNRLVRTRYENGGLGTREILLDKFQGETYHDGSRIVIGPDRFIYMTMGEAGVPSLAQDQHSLNGKILRLTLEGKPAPDNPFGNEIWTWGHRNPQGLVFHPVTGMLFSSEHGPNTDDELNLIEPGRNYGWPQIRGRCDSREERDFCSQERVAEALYFWTPTVGITGIDFYDNDRIPGWKGSLLATSLHGSLFRITLSADGRRVTEVESFFERKYGRLRDVLAGPDGAVYIATSNRDGRGSPQENDDRILRITPAPL